MALKKKTNTNLYQQQGMTQTTMPLMPQSAMVNPEAEKVGLGGTQLTNGKLNVINVTPKAPEPEVEPEPNPKPNRNDYKTNDEYNKAYDQYKNREMSEVYGGAYAKDIQQQQAEQQMAQQAQILQELGAVGNISQSELNGLVEQYGLTGRQQFKEGAAGAFREALPGAAQAGFTAGMGAALVGAVGTGATAGAIGGPVGIAVGAAAGVVFGLWRGLAKARKAEAKEDVTNAMAEFTQMKTGMTQVATLASAGYINASEAVELYNAHLTRMLQIESQIKYLQDTNLKDYLSDGSDDLAQVQSYLNNVAPVYAMRIRSALMNPTTKVPYSDIVMQDLQDGTNTQG